jgi:hypothetical protein
VSPRGLWRAWLRSQEYPEHPVVYTALMGVIVTLGVATAVVLAIRLATGQ